jgi:hypothetical protein
MQIAEHEGSWKIEAALLSLRLTTFSATDIVKLTTS